MAAQADFKVGRGIAQLKAPVCLSQISLLHLRMGAVADRHVGPLSSRAGAVRDLSRLCGRTTLKRRRRSMLRP
eukprot:5940347-Pyramimonas_sp.AAC.1